MAEPNAYPYETSAETTARMRRVRQRDTPPEMKLRRALWRAGLRYRLGVRVERTRPDIVFTRQRVAVFVDGCFWHGCPRHYVSPVRNARFWRAKLERNMARDKQDTLKLEDAGWRVLRFWECEVDENVAALVEAVSGTLGS